MFTGIIESIGVVEEVIIDELNIGNKSFWIRSGISGELKIDQSISHNGVCLTVAGLKENMHLVTAVRETLDKATLRSWLAGRHINLERCLMANGRLDGHFVQGHVDGVGVCMSIADVAGSKEIVISFSEEFAPLIVEKGSISVDGVSLTCFDVSKESFKVAIIPYTWEHTAIQQLSAGGHVNLEFDILGKYLNRRFSLGLPID